MKKDTRLPRMSCPFFYCLTSSPTLFNIKEYTPMKFEFLTLLLISFIAFSSCSENQTNGTTKTGDKSLLDNEMFSKNPVDRLDEKDFKSTLNLPEEVVIKKSSYLTSGNEAGLIEYKWVNQEGKKEKVSISFLERVFTKTDKPKEMLNARLSRGTLHGTEKVEHMPVRNLGEGASWSPRLKQLCWYKGNAFYSITAKGKPGNGDFLDTMKKIAAQF